MIDVALRERLLNSIEANRLVIFCGAGLSMAPPSELPSAYNLALHCSGEYQTRVGVTLHEDVRGDLEKIAEHFVALGQLYSTFISRLVPREQFNRKPNSGHFAAADFLASGIVECVVSTNFDTLIEEAARSLGESFTEADIDVEEANIKRDRRPHLKIHGCLTRDPKNTLWCKSQLETPSTLKTRHDEFKLWLTTNLRGRDLLFVGFWSDWSYLNSVLGECLGGIDPSLVVIVNRSDETVLQSKAPELWELSGGPKVNRFVVNESADTFLTKLRTLVWRTFVERLHRESVATYSAMTGKPLTMPPALPTTLSCEDVYSLHLDVCGVPVGQVARTKTPDASMKMLGAVHIGLLNDGASVDGRHFLREGQRLRVVYGQGQTLSDVRRRYQSEPADFIGADVTICVGAKDDGGVPPDVVRGAGQVSTIVRPAGSPNWLTDDDAKHYWGGTPNVATAQH